MRLINALPRPIRPVRSERRREFYVQLRRPWRDVHFSWHADADWPAVPGCQCDLSMRCHGQSARSDPSGAVSFTFNYDGLGATCILAGTLTQTGQLYQVANATYQCAATANAPGPIRAAP